MKMLLSCCAGCAVMLACIAYADIPSYVDFHAIQSVPFDGTTQPTWSIVPNLFDNDAPVWWLGGDGLDIDDKSTGLQVKQIWLEIEFVDAAAAEPWKDKLGDPAAYYPGAYGYDQDSNIILAETGSIKAHVRDERFITWEWVFIFQPGYESVEFAFFDTGDNDWARPNVGGFDYNEDDVLDIEQLEVATYGSVIPAPASLLLCGIGIGCTVLMRRFRR